jgi:OOP family OmpA-OmpF porin
MRAPSPVNPLTRRTGAIVGILMAALWLSGCYFPTNGIRDPNPGPSASPPWPYEPGVYPPGGGQPSMAQGTQRNAPATMHVPPAQAAYPQPYQQPYPQPYQQQYPQPYAQLGQTPPPPSTSIPAQYADWLFDGPEGRGFAWYLAQGYRRYAKHEDNAHDFEDAAKFLARAAAVERGEAVEPEQLTMRTLPAYAVEDLAYARQRLMRALNNGAAQRLPKIAANAQVAFDCWMEQQEENTQPHDVARCRNAFEAFIVRLEPRPLPTPAAAPVCPPVEAACMPSSQLVFFDFDRHDLTPAGRETVRAVAEQAQRAPVGTLIVSGHADRSGSDQYNDALSKRRLDTVIDALMAAGLPRERLARAEYFGERQTRVATPDGVRQPENRRVEIRLSCAVPAVAASGCAAPSLPVEQPACAPMQACPMQGTQKR